MPGDMAAKPSPPGTGTSSSGRAIDMAKAAFRWYGSYAPYSPPPEICRGVAAFGPEVVYSALEDRRISGVALACSRRLSVPLVPHFMDDWMTTAAAPRRGLVEKWARRDLEHKAGRALREAPVALVIGEYMAEAYRLRYGREFLAFSNCVDLAARPVVHTDKPAPGIFRFGFTGGMLFGRGDTFADVLEALEGLRVEGVSVEVVIYQHDRRKPLPDRVARSPVARLADTREESLLETAEAEIDALLHIDTFEATAGTYLRLSLSGKVPWYLAAGLPLFAYGAPTLGTIRLLREYECAAIVDRRDREVLKHGLRGFLDDPVVRRALGAQARRVAQEHFDARRKREAFRRVFAEVCAERLS